MNSNYSEILERIKEQTEIANNIIITTHTNPDGDAIGSSLALYHALKSINKNVSIISDSPVPFQLEFLEGVEDIKVFNKQRDYHDFLMADTIFILDLNDPKRLKSAEQYVTNSSAKKILIDHHIEPRNFTNMKLVDTDSTSTGELIWHLLQYLNINITKKIAEAIFVAIMTDTGNFRHFRTDAETFKIASNLIENGADPVYLYDRIYNNNSLAGTVLLGEALRSIQLYFNGLVSVMVLPANVIENCGAGQDDIEGFVEKTLSVKGAQIGVLLADVSEKDEVRMSFRSKNDYSVRNLAAIFGGGGHFHAAGARLKNTTVFEAREIVLNKIKELYKL